MFNDCSINTHIPYYFTPISLPCPPNKNYTTNFKQKHTHSNDQNITLNNNPKLNVYRKDHTNNIH